MSFFLIYFETPNKESEDYRGFSEVGKFSVPANICAGTVAIEFLGRKFTGSLISDESHQAANDIFRKANLRLRDQLLGFIQSRLTNRSIRAHLSGYIESNDKRAVEIGSSVKMDFTSLSKSFRRELFQVGVALEITTR